MLHRHSNIINRNNRPIFLQLLNKTTILQQGVPKNSIFKLPFQQKLWFISCGGSTVNSSENYLFCRKLRFCLSLPTFIFATRCRRPWILRSNNLSLKFHRIAPSDFKDIEIRQFEFVAKSF